MNTASASEAPSTTWLFVRMKPSGVMTKPDPVPSCLIRSPAWATLSATTDGPTASTTPMTASE